MCLPTAFFNTSAFKYNYKAIYTDCPLSCNQNKVIKGDKCKAAQAGVCDWMPLQDPLRGAPMLITTNSNKAHYEN